jgi:hypothetical protein
MPDDGPAAQSRPPPGYAVETCLKVLESSRVAADMRRASVDAARESTMLAGDGMPH